MTSDPYQSLLSAAFRFVTIRARSERELVAYLTKKASAKKFPIDIVSRVHTRMQELGYVDDRKFAQSLVESRMHGKPKGPLFIKRELQVKGIASDIIESVLASALQEEGPSQKELAIKALGKKGERYKTLPVLECKRKVYDFLLRRGFSSSIVGSLVDEWCQKTYNKTQEDSLLL